MVEVGEAVKAERLVISLPGEAREQLEGLAGEDGLSLGAEVRSLVKREVARRKSRRRIIPGVSASVCAGCPRMR